MMKKPEVTFKVFGHSGPLCIHWHPGPYGAAVEAKKGEGVAWFAANGDLLAAEFDHVAKDFDRQTLEFPHYRIEVLVKSGKVTVNLQPTKRPHQQVA